jgi:hypothetical protein
VGARIDVDDVETRKILSLLGLELRPLGRPARSQSPYRHIRVGLYVYGGTRRSEVQHEDGDSMFLRNVPINGVTI